MNNRSYLLLIFCWLSLFGRAQQKTIHEEAGEIEVDGVLNEKSWGKATVFTNFHNYYPNDEGAAENQTEVRVFHDGENLYFGVVYHDSSPENKISTLKRDNHGGAVVGSDAFGIILDPFNKESNGYYFTLSVGNVQQDALINFNGTDYDFVESWNTVWQSKTSTDGNKKIYEIAIPFTALNFDVNNAEWGVQFFYRDFKINNWTTYTDMSRNFFQFDLRFTEDVKIEALPEKKISRLTVIPSVTYVYENDVENEAKSSTFRPSGDIQYNFTSSLRLDATINPDFSQVDVDQQVVNLTRFDVYFPERRNFFLENNDLFSNLGTVGVNPFYSRVIGGTTNMLFGLKLSGNVSQSTRIGVLNAQTEKRGDVAAQNYSVLVGKQRLSKAFSATAYWVNRQETDRFNFTSDYNRVFGVNLNYKSKNNRWSGLANYGKSFSNGLNSVNNFLNVEGQYNTRKTFMKAALKSVEENFTTDVGFTPRLYNYDPINDEVNRSSYWDSYAVFQKTYYPKKSGKIDRYRYLSFVNDGFWNNRGELYEMKTVLGNSIWFRNNLSSLYVNLQHDYFDLQYGFDILANNQPISPGAYSTFGALLGFDNRSTNKNLYYATEVFYGGYFNGERVGVNAELGIRMLPFAHLNFGYSMDDVNLRHLGKETFHLARLTGEIFFNTRLNWTTYVQYNTQQDNFNVTSRLQWEYRSLSYVYFVVTDNLNRHMNQKNWGFSIKVNYRFDF